MSTPSHNTGTVTQSSSVVEELIWQDRDLRFDCAQSLLSLRRGEFQIDTASSVEDTKGNHSETGTLTVTNLRFIYISTRDVKSNISIGLSCVTAVSLKSGESRIKGRVHTANITTKQGTNRFEFVFSITQPDPAIKTVPSVLTALSATHRAYESTRLYRDLKLRGAIIADHTLILLPGENIYSRIEGVWNLSSDQGNLGTLFVTQIRLVWHANLAENFNVSIPLMQIKVAKLRDSKFGHALVIETTPRSGGYILGFRIDPMDKLTNIFQEIKTLHEVYSTNPVFGVAVTGTAAPQEPQTQATVKPNTDDVEIVSDDHGDALAQCYLSESQSGQKELEYSMELGLAVEKLREKTTVGMLWNVAVT